jgi:signal transduction histidine kinase
MNNNWTKPFSSYFFFQMLSALIIFLSVMATNYYSKLQQANLISLNIRNELIIGDFKSSQFGLNNGIKLGFENIVIENFQEHKKILYSEPLNTNSFFTLYIKNQVTSALNSNQVLYIITFHFSLKPIIYYAFMIWFLFFILSIPYLFIIKKRLEKEFNEKLIFDKNFALQEMALQVSHDIRSPLAAINQLKDELENKENFEVFENAIKKINLIADNLLNFDRGELTHFEVVEIVELIRTTIRLKEIEKKISIAFTTNVKTINVKISAIDFSRVFSNLINNSIDAKKSDVQISVQVDLTLHNDFIELKIIDNGIGISEAKLKDIGKQKSINYQKNNSGNGLGLTSAFKILKAWNSSLEITSTHNIGTIVKINIPIFTIINNLESCIVLIENDELSSFNWSYKAKKKNLNFTAYKSPDDFFKNLNLYKKDTLFFIDSELDDTKGEDIALKLFELGFTELYLTTGYSKDRFSHLKFIKDVIDKTPPF